ncbi:MAG: hypothetical protein HY021_06810 [Burkholderiales bacterium]|nr:hypothetical protein [Burkholderiales bacterium]
MFDGLIAAARAGGRSPLALLIESVRLRFGWPHLGWAEYLDFRLHEPALSFDAKRRFGGWRAQHRLEQILVDDKSMFMTLDKITMYALLRAHGLPVPTVRAAYRGARPRALPNPQTPAQLAALLRQPGFAPVYLKPSFGAYGRGNTLLAAVDDDHAVLGDGSRVALDAFCASLDDGRGLGWVLQDALTPHPQIAALCGDKISGVRVHSFLAPDGPRILKAVWKVNLGAEDSDNFRHGASGNLLASVDVASGRVRRTIAGVGLARRVDPPHPRTGRALTGFTLPDWPAMVALVRDAQLAFPGFLCPGWDIALTDQGPLILEVNAFGDIDLPQHADGAGFLDDALLDAMRSRGIDGLRQTRSQPRRHWPW